MEVDPVFSLHLSIIVAYHTSMDPAALHVAMDLVSPGSWAVGVSGGADSVALLLLLHAQTRLKLHVVHLDHETRDGDSEKDALFVRELADTLNLPCTVQRRSVVESTIHSIALNTPSRFRQARLALFRRVIEADQLSGVVLAHHADDQAETILMRILRGSSLPNLAGIQPDTIVNGIRILRPLLPISSKDLRHYLQERRQSWREDVSNQSDQYQRNRIRQWLDDLPAVRIALIDVGRNSHVLRNWLNAHSPTLGLIFRTKDLSDLPEPLARHAAARWLIERGSPPTEINHQTCQRLIKMAADSASPVRQNFPGGLFVQRRRGEISTKS